LERLWGKILRNMPRGTNMGTSSSVRAVHGVTAIGFDVEPTEEHSAVVEISRLIGCTRTIQQMIHFHLFLAVCTVRILLPVL
jgi:hypothetical protein